MGNRGSLPPTGNDDPSDEVFFAYHNLWEKVKSLKKLIPVFLKVVSFVKKVLYRPKRASSREREKENLPSNCLELTSAHKTGFSYWKITNRRLKLDFSKVHLRHRGGVYPF